MTPGHPQRHYTLICPVCHRRTADDGLVLTCGEDHPAAFLRTGYQESRLTVCPDSDGLYRYRRWLPITRTLAGAGGTIVSRGERLGRALGLRDLWIAFNGYWPERGAHLRSATFKELEAYTVLGRLPDRPPILVIPSVGNTGAAFASVFAQTGGECVIIVPERGLHRLASETELPSAVRLVALTGGDYDDAIGLGERVSRLPGFQAVGGAWNVARRDGLATVLLSAAETMGRLPEFYVQAVGSAVGAIAVHEAAGRLIASGEYGQARPRLLMCQNASYAPVRDLWRFGSVGRGHAARDVYADELTNRNPPYFVRGGIRDALAESGGRVLVADHASARAAAELFLETEGIDIEPAASVALACLREAVAGGEVSSGASVLLNITGGGRAHPARARLLRRVEPTLRLGREELGSPETPGRIGALFPSADGVVRAARV